MATMLLVRHLKAFDIPNERSSHTRITPRGGGVAPTSSAAATGMTSGNPGFLDTQRNGVAYSSLLIFMMPWSSSLILMVKPRPVTSLIML
jgi:UDP-N-acetylmuramyl pentapeptide phosphotransferase/UDP-N-acetylglucosamine-1-phosphate transferase